MRRFDVSLTTNPLLRPSAPVQRRLQGPPANSKLLAVKASRVESHHSGSSAELVHFHEELPDLFHRADPSAITPVRETVPKLFDLVVPNLVAVHAVFVVVGSDIV